MSTSGERLASEPILDIQPYQPGKPIEELERELGVTGPVDLASTENPFTVGTPEENARLVEALRTVLGQEGARS